MVPTAIPAAPVATSTGAAKTSVGSAVPGVLAAGVVVVDAAVPVDAVLPDVEATEEPLVPEPEDPEPELELELLDPVVLDLVELEPEVPDVFVVLEVVFEELELLVVFESSLYVLLKVALLYDAWAESFPLLFSVTVTVTLAE